MPEQTPLWPRQLARGGNKISPLWPVARANDAGLGVAPAATMSLIGVNKPVQIEENIADVNALNFSADELVQVANYSNYCDLNFEYYRRYEKPSSVDLHKGKETNAN